MSAVVSDIRETALALAGEYADRANPSSAELIAAARGYADFLIALPQREREYAVELLRRRRRRARWETPADTIEHVRPLIAFLGDARLSAAEKAALKEDGR